ncbi:hypothetical protein VNO77_22817 [Canavalia gladiata]|uniref:Uncharacterized protein n=1 Tax=Canavalia gladiata TaxID=3824 RepID=A0AAN9Q8C0_CANGL
MLPLYSTLVLSTRNKVIYGTREELAQLPQDLKKELIEAWFARGSSKDWKSETREDETLVQWPNSFSEG